MAALGVDGSCIDKLEKVAEAVELGSGSVTVSYDIIAVESRKAKRRKLGESDCSTVCDFIVDVGATTPRSQIDITTVTEEIQPEESDDDREEERENVQSSIAMPLDFADSVNDRLNVLQHLIPHALELDEDEILRVAIDYVKALEMEIQMFDRSKQDGPAFDSTASQVDVGTSSDVPDTSGTSEGSALQKRGLCIVPLSALAKAF